jgi:hypothetical protein
MSAFSFSKNPRLERMCRQAGVWQSEIQIMLGSDVLAVRRCASRRIAASLLLFRSKSDLPIHLEG